ncbi:conjugal transfer protein TraM [Yersinia enterocolitica]|nr:conjugal transfer protein TraM [Yersinia enterocolitica]MBX9492191.1 conjugal transfer protein TraM [Yersinia enterocolitica]
MKQKTLDGIRKLVDERKAEGASSSEVNMSSMGAELLEIGLRVTQNMKKKSTSESPEQIFNRMLMEECVKSRVAIQEMLTMFFSVQEIKEDSRFSYSLQVEKMKGEVASIVERAFPKSE